MSSPITLSGFNQVDFGSIIDAILAQERVPMRGIETAKSKEKSRLDAYGQLASKLSALDNAKAALSTSGAFSSFRASSGNESVLTASAGTGAAAGSHTITVDALASAQVMASTSLTATTDTVVADGGSLVIGSSTFAVTEDTTLAALRDQINGDPNAAARASLVDTGSGVRLVLTARESGTAGAFTVQNNMTLSGGASGVTFGDKNKNGVSGDSKQDNAVEASDASLTIDNVDVTRGSNTVAGALPGVTLTLAAVGTTTVTVEADSAAAKSQIEAFVSAYNELSGFIQKQYSSSGQAGPLAGDFLARSASSEIRAALRSVVDTGGAYRNLAEIGIVFERTGELSINETKLNEVLSANREDVSALFLPTAGEGLVARLDATIDRYLGSSGLLRSVEDRIDSVIRSLDGRLASMEERLVLREDELRNQFTAADKAISSLNAQLGSLTALGNQLRLF